MTTSLLPAAALSVRSLGQYHTLRRRSGAPRMARIAEWSLLRPSVKGSSPGSSGNSSAAVT